MLIALCDHQHVVSHVFVDDIPGASGRLASPPIRNPCRCPMVCTSSLHVPQFVPSTDTMGPGCAGRYCLRKSRNLRSPIKQIPVLSFLRAVTNPARPLSRGPASCPHYRPETDSCQVPDDQLGAGSSSGLYCRRRLCGVGGAARGIGLHVMACGNQVGAQLRGVVEKGANLISRLHKMSGLGVRRAVLRQEVVEDAVPVFCREIGAMEADPN